MNGTVKFFSLKNGFGFITLDGGQDIYFNKAGLPRDRRYDPIEGDRVAFDVRDGRMGQIAHHIEQLDV